MSISSKNITGEKTMNLTEKYVIENKTTCLDPTAPSGSGEPNGRGDGAAA